MLPWKQWRDNVQLVAYNTEGYTKNSTVDNWLGSSEIQRGPRQAELLWAEKVIDVKADIDSSVKALDENSSHQ